MTDTSSYDVREAMPEDELTLVAVAKATDLFTGEELTAFGGMISAHFQEPSPDHHWLVLEEGGVIGAAYVSPEEMADRVWNLWFIGLLPDYQGKGGGSVLIRAVEELARGAGARMLLVETSGVDDFRQTRAFYEKAGYDREARIRDYYGPGADKVVFRKAFQP